ncbi:protein-glutamate O-methyltransferase [Methylomonas sp. EFPC3]|uniref:CheR family methyltransferase n=1 Tax=Methylomonas sp. EFPC3 TaxID=3021710 RepID=UPI002415BD10|nr:protein-glutamate O-methyltransferase [Methylomonas sp. EFPC3]WFP51595.1 protein-glutamate O-methyltransferase [Methylomonas sp. EFPC3]
MATSNMASSIREFEYTHADFDVLRKISRQYSGILVPDDKFDMFYSRLAKRIRLLGLSSFKEYCQYLTDHPDTEFTEFINAVTTNLTAFFRENHHFEYLSSTVVPELLRKKAGVKQVKIWSAGCSTGEEPYSLAITLKERLPADWDIKILATDLDTNVLATAASGVYSEERVTGIAEQRLKRWFQKGSGRQANKVRVRAELRQLIAFRQLNLMQEWPMRGGFDAIFCRNVLIYFDRETKAMLAERYAGLLDTGGCLFIGHSESLHQLDTAFDPIGNTIYRKARK